MSKLQEYRELCLQINDLKINNLEVPKELQERRKDLYIDALIEVETEMEFEIFG